MRALVTAGRRTTGYSRSVAGRSRDSFPDGFTLVELLVTIAICGVLMSLLLAAVQVCRDSARKTSCANNVRQQALALQQFHLSERQFPAGRYLTKNAEYAWSVAILPHLEQRELQGQLDRRLPWSAASNQAAADATLPVFCCPAAVRKLPGKTDYGGLMGSALGQAPGFEIENGALVEVGGKRAHAIREADIIDGLSNTLAVAESADRALDKGGRWVSGFNCFTHDNGQINAENNSEIFSRHPGGAAVGFADGRVHFLSKQTAPGVIGALCTRNGGEVVGEF